MDRKDTVAWVVSVCALYVRASQAKTLGNLVAAAMHCRRISLANIGRNMLGTVKHQIKRCWRFCANDRIEPSQAMWGVVKRLIEKRKKPLLIAFDWVDIKGYQTLMASVVLKGRALPICWASCQGHVYDGHRSRNAFEEALLLVLRSMIPEKVQVILLADRGFGRTELARFCQRNHFQYVIRIQPKVCVRSPDATGFTGKLLDYPVHKGICKLLKSVAYRSGKNPVIHNVVVRWVRGLPPKRDECWFLMTSLSAGPAQISHLYARRMSIEELFRDSKNKRNGWALRDTQLSTPERLDRMLLILAIAYLLLCGIGLLARRRYKPSAWCSSSKEQCGIFQIGLTMLTKMRTGPPRAFAAVFKVSQEVAEKWG